MSSPPQSSLVKILVPIAALALLVFVGVALFRQPAPKAQPAPATTATPATQPPTQPAATTPAGTAPTTPPTQPAAQPPTTSPAPPAAELPVARAADPTPPTTTPPTTSTPTPPATPAATFRARPLDPGVSQAFAPLGSLEAAAGQSVRLEFSPIGAGIAALDLARYHTTIRRTEHVRIQETRAFTATDAQGQQWSPTAVPFALTTLQINGVDVNVSGLISDSPASPPRPVPIWRELAPGVFECTIVDERDTPVATVRREFIITPGDYTIQLRQTATNLTAAPMAIRWVQIAGVDMPMDKLSYGGDVRRVRFGFQFRPEQQGADPAVLGQGYLWNRASGDVLGRADKATRAYPAALQVWPNASSARDGLRLVWTGMTSRYFGVAAFPNLEPTTTDKAWTRLEAVHRLLLNPASADPKLLILATSLTSTAQQVAPAAAADFSMNIFGGPLSKPEIRSDARAAAAGLEGLIVYNFGGLCGPCTFEILTHPLIWLLRTLASFIVFDWALAIIVLVLIVRSILHPVTRWSQIRIQRFGKQMGDLAPKQKKIQEKYGSDPQKMREEMAKLWREEGVNPAGMLGCLPMFLQTPVWIALYATLFFAIELRHQGAFFGVFQALTAGQWSFLGDLAEPDHFIEFGRGFHIPLLSTLMGDITGINILPVILGIVFFIQQKYLTPPTTAPLTPEQEMQQKMIKFMMVFMFPLLMYNAPSGLAIYFIANSTLGILESKWIRAHITKHGLLEVKKRAPGDKPSFMQRLQQIAEERQKQMLKAKGMPPPAKRRSRDA